MLPMSVEKHKGIVDKGMGGVLRNTRGRLVVNYVDVEILTNRGRRASGARSSRRRWAGRDTCGRAGDAGMRAAR